MIKRYKQNETDTLAKILKNDGVISVPTDTVYGVCARINSKKAHDNLVKTKNRPITKPFPVMCSDEEQIKSIAIVNEKAEKIIKEFMPGPITLILEKRPEVPEYVNNGKATIAVRMATSKAVKELIIKNKNIIYMALPFIVMDVVTRIFGNSIGFYKVYRLFPNLFTLLYIYLFLGIVLNTNKKVGKISYLFFNILFVIMYLVNNVYYSMTSNYFSFNLLDSVSEGSPYFLSALKNCNIFVWIFENIIILCAKNYIFIDKSYN